MNIELVYFEGCPNVEAARDNIRKACSELNLEADWKEWDQNDDALPKRLKVYGSPSILVSNKDVAGGAENCCQAKSCRIYEGNENAPDVETIKAALEEKLAS